MASATTPARQSEGPPQFLALLEASKGEIARVVPEHVKADRVVRVARTAWQMDPKLRQCEPTTIIGAVMKACELGLEPGGALRHAYLVPYKGECQLILGYAGLLDLARRTGQYKAIGTQVVHEEDAFTLRYTPEVVFDHQPCLTGERGKETHAYAWAKLTSDELAFEVMTREEIEAIRRRAPSANSPAWRDFWGEMARKVVLKRFLKRMPLAVEFADVIDRDNALEERLAAAVQQAFPGGTRGLVAELKSRRGEQALPAPEPEFDASEGVAEPLRVEGPEEDLRGDLEDEQPREREPGED